METNMDKQEAGFVNVSEGVLRRLMDKIRLYAGWFLGFFDVKIIWPNMRFFVRPYPDEMKHAAQRLSEKGLLNIGWGCGYVLIPPGHPFYAMPYEEIPVKVHGGLTFSEYANDMDWEETQDEDKKYVIGFDTAHYKDSPESWPKSRVLEETYALETQCSCVPLSTVIYCYVKKKYNAVVLGRYR